MNCSANHLIKSNLTAHLRKSLFCFFALIILAGYNVSAQTIATYAGTGGTSTAVTGVANETVTALQTVGFGTNTPCSSGGMSGLTNNGVTVYVPTNAHLFFQIRPNTGYALNVTGFSAGLRRSNSGLQKVRFAYSLDNGVTWIDDGVDHAPNNGGCGTSAVSNWGGGALPTGISSTTDGIIIALYPYATIATGGVIQVNTIVIDGDVVPSDNPPSFAGGATQSLSVCENSSATSINSLMAINDLDVGQTETWTVVTPPANGALGGFSTSAISNGSTVTPTGLTYTPTAGFTGTDAFTIQISDGILTATTVVTVTVNPSPSAISGSTSVCQGTTTMLVNGVTGGIWSSSNTGVATIGSLTGLVTGISASGTTTISYTLGSCGTATIVTVNSFPAAISGSSFSLCQGSTITLTDATSGGAWSSSIAAVGTVGSATGVVYGVGTGASVGAGTTTITYTSAGGCTATAIVTVYALPDAIAGINVVCQGATTSLSDLITGGVWSTVAGTGTVSVVSGTVTGLTTPPLTQGTATVSYSFGSGTCAVSTVVTIDPVSPISSAMPVVCSGLTTSVSDAVAGTWTSSNTTVATIGSATGDITGLTAGTSTIVISYTNGCSTNVVLTVNLSPVAISGSGTLCYGSTTTYLDGTPGGTWASSNATIATIGSSSGAINTVSAAGGMTTISYLMPTGCMATTILTVNPAPPSIGGVLAVCTGLTTTLTDPTPGGGWLSSNATNAPIDPSSGTVSGIIGGTVVMSYTLLGCSATAVVTVNVSPVAISGNTNLCAGIAGQLTDGSSGGSWTSSNMVVATVGSNTGIVSPLSYGTTVISYVYSTGCNAATTVSVNSSPSAITGTLNSCTGYFTPLNDAAGGGIWSSANTAAGTISSTGLVFAVAPGTTSIAYTYTATGCYAGAVFTVNPAPAAIGGTPYVCDGQTATFNDPTPGGAWSSNTTNASVGLSSGIVQGLNAGTATIVYMLAPGCFATYSVTVTQAPTPISGANNVCAGGATALADEVTGGTWSMAAGSGMASISATGIFTAANAGIAVVSYSTPACNAVNYIITVNPLPDAITGIGNLCLGSSTSLTDASAGGTWSSSNTGATISSTGVVSGVDTGAGTSISYTLPTGCYVVAPVVIFPSPAAIMGTDTVCPGSSVVLSSSTPGGVWSSSNGTIAKSIAITGEVDGMTGGTVNISYTFISGCYVTVPFVVENPLPASLTVTQSLDTIKCNGVPDTLTAQPVNGGNATFEWENWGAYIDTGRVFQFLPTHGDYITCVMTTHDICSSPASVQTSIVMNVYPDVAPTVVISTSSSDTSSYLGQVYTFFTNVTYGGTDPGYQWYINSAAVPGATNSTFTTHVYDYNDSVYCAVAGNSPCDTGIIGNSDTIIIHGIDNLSAGALSVSGSDLNLFPNPNTGSFTLSGTVGGTMNKEVQLAVTDMLGRTVYTGTATPQNGTISAEIKLDNDVATGTYLLRVSTETGIQAFHFVIGK